MMEFRESSRTIRDFGEQWVRYTANDGYYGSLAMLSDVMEPLVPVQDLKGARVAEIGSGTGRIVRMMLEAGASHVTALEPSKAMDVLRKNTAHDAQKITYVQTTGECIPDGQYDLIVSIGVLHHIPRPEPVVAAAYKALRPGGRMLVWLYGWEGNEAYLSFAIPLRFVTTRLPHAMLAPIAWTLTALLAIYVALARVAPLPLHRYMNEVVRRLSWKKRYLVIYDQLNPHYAKYYRQQEAVALLEEAGFSDVRTMHRHGYSWTAVGTKPMDSNTV